MKGTDERPLRERLRDLEDAYKFREDEDGIPAKLKWVLERKLDAGERKLLIHYAEAGSFRKAAPLLGVSHTTAAKLIRRVRLKVISEFEKIKDNDDLC